MKHSLLYIFLPLLLLDYNFKLSLYSFYGGNQCRMCSTKIWLLIFPFAFFFFSLYWPLAFLITFSHQRNKISIALLSKFVSFGFLFVFLLVFLSLALVLFCIIHVSVKRELHCKDLATYNIMCENKFQSPTVTIN